MCPVSFLCSRRHIPRIYVWVNELITAFELISHCGEYNGRSLLITCGAIEPRGYTWESIKRCNMVRDNIKLTIDAVNIYLK